MTGLQIFAFYVLPLCIAAGGWIYFIIVEREFKREDEKRAGK
jgi:hypothetical protein